MSAATNSERKVASREDIDTALDGVEEMLVEDANRPLSDEEKAALVRVKKRLDDQLAGLVRK